ncbi:MAG: endolytic transglycosylase MltG, partial [Odoribacter sp.]|nr:endolytic transglycosylase MltG [Odoribacter sp.]
MKKAYWGILTVVVLAGMTAAFGYYYFVSRPNVVVEDDGIVFIQPEDSFETVVGLLRDKGYLRNEYTFRKVAELKKYPDRVKSGRYKIGNGMNNNQLVNLLRSGRQEPIYFTFNNIRTLADFAGTLSRQLAVDSTE